MKEGAPKYNPKLEKTGIGPGGYPEYKVVREEENSQEVTEEEFEALQKKVGISEKMPGDLKPKNRQALRAFLFSLGIALTPMKGGNDAEAAISKTKDTSFSHEIDTLDRIRNSENDLSEFDKKVKEVVEMISPYDIAKTMEYANKPVVGAEDYTRAQYVAEAIQFTPWNEETGEGVPPAVEAELRRLLPGLCAQESRYDASRVSKAGAMGILQIMPNNWERYGGKPGEETSLVAQVEVAGKLLSDMYRQLHDRLGDEVVAELQGHFPSEEAFQTDFLVPVLINSYNAGDGRLAEAVVSYLHDTMPDDRPEGKDLFTAIGTYAFEQQSGLLRGFKKHSKNYPYQVEALTYHFDINNEDNPKRG
jgi:hypothetical protein